MGTADDIARSLGRLAAAVRAGVRTLAPLDTNPVPADWRHVTKVDPEDQKKLPLLYPLYLRHTDAVSVGGSAAVTAENTRETFELLERVPGLSAFHEPSAARHVTEETRAHADFLAVPEVVNGDAESLVGTLGEGVEYIREEVAPAFLAGRLPGWATRRWGRRLADFGASWLVETAVFEAYIIQNLDSAAAREANVTEADLLDPRGAARRALAAERHLGSEVVYVEYSGTFGGDEAVALLEAVDDTLSWSRLWYGGGLDSRANALRILEAGADTVVVGNVFHEIAAEEQALVGRALDALGPDAGPAALDDWLDECIDIGDTHAARYLSTIPAVDDPRETAHRYVVRTIQTLLSIERLAREVEADGVATERDLRAALDASAAGRDLLDTLENGSRNVVREYAVDRLAARIGVDASTDAPVAHVSRGPHT